jgi:hypothetical protein
MELYEIISEILVYWKLIRDLIEPKVLIVLVLLENAFQQVGHEFALLLGFWNW